MEFDKGKVVSFMTYEAAKWCGYMGFYANSLSELRKIVENDDKTRYGMLVIADCDCENLEKPFGINWEDSQSPDEDCDVIAEYFYPVERKKESEKRHRPYRSLSEMAEDFNSYQYNHIQYSTYDLMRLLIGKTIAKNGIAFTIIGLDCNENSILVCDNWIDMEELHRNGWMHPDADNEVMIPCGIEIEEGDES